MNRPPGARVEYFKPVPANIDYPALLASLENELVNLITETLWQLERIGELQRKIRSVTEEIRAHESRMSLPPETSPEDAGVGAEDGV